MNEQQITCEHTREELDRLINDCRIRILEQCGCEVPQIIREGASNGKL